MTVVLLQGIPILHIDLQGILLKVEPYQQQLDFLSVDSYAARLTSLCKLTLGHVICYERKLPNFYIDGICDDTDISRFLTV